MAVSACGGARPVAVWPPPHPVALAPAPLQEPPAPSPEATDAAAPASTDAAAPPVADAYVEHAPGILVREGEAEGLGYLEIVFGSDPQAALPLLFVLHGRGDRPHVPGGPFEGLAEPLRVVMPRGPRVVGEGFGWFSVIMAQHEDGVLADELREESARLARMIALVRQRLPTQGPPMVSGFSQGGMLALALAVHHGEGIGLAVPLAGWLPPGLLPEGGPPAGAPPIRAMHGRADDRIPFEPAEAVYARLRELRWDVAVRAFDVGHAMSPEMDGLFHVWLERAVQAIQRGEGLLADPDAPAVQPAPAPRQQRARRPRPRRGARDGRRSGGSRAGRSPVASGR